MKTQLKSIFKLSLSTITAAFAFAAVTALAGQTPLAVKDDAAQLMSDKAALQRQLNRLETDEARLEYDRNSGRMSAESKDTYDVYLDRQAIKGEKKDLATDKRASRQMKSDKAALHRLIKRLDLAEARLKSDAKEGKLAAESNDSEKVFKDQLAIRGEKKAIATDTTKLQVDQKK